MPREYDTARAAAAAGAADGLRCFGRAMVLPRHGSMPTRISTAAKAFQTACSGRAYFTRSAKPGQMHDFRNFLTAHSMRFAYHLITPLDDAAAAARRTSRAPETRNTRLISLPAPSSDARERPILIFSIRHAAMAMPPPRLATRGLIFHAGRGSGADRSAEALGRGKRPPAGKVVSRDAHARTHDDS